MPELPEVERIKRMIEPQIKGLSIDNLIVNTPNIISHPSPKEFINSVLNKEIEMMSRRGKFITIHLDTKDRIVLHLRMTGQLIVRPIDTIYEKHTHLIFNLSNKTQLRYIDPRKFGRFWFINKNEDDTYTGINKLGLEYFDSNFCVEYLKDKLSKKNKTIKQCLLDQNIVAGIGNIYADEILFASAICPTRKANSLTDNEYEILYINISKILNSAVEDYPILPDEGYGKKYGNDDLIKIYGHANEPCPRCKKLLTKINISGRSSVYCENCQK